MPAGLLARGFRSGPLRRPVPPSRALGLSVRGRNGYRNRASRLQLRGQPRLRGSPRVTRSRCSPCGPPASGCQP